MRYALFLTEMGHSGVVFNEQDVEPKAVRVYLPGSRQSIEQSIRHLFPGSSEMKSALPELCSLVQQFLRGDSILIPFELVDTSVCYSFQLDVLRAERKIPRGTVASYSWVAKRIGTRAVRAVGTALARNPFPIVVPCHRAVRSDGSLGGFQGGLEMKRKLLEMEGIRLDSRGRVDSRFMNR